MSSHAIRNDKKASLFIDVKIVLIDRAQQSWISKPY
jgi:hypothetical protein